MQVIVMCGGYYEHFKEHFHRINNLHGIAASILLRTQLFFNDEDILAFPMGEKLLKIAKKLKFLKKSDKN